ncbi:hypothetical protein Pyn_00877 [Prunus yedoensis var. nudiflora]|uniref:Uncharacterized protein n=1 Tax=Prunus yedoensis var. nudiflora TaxID=2094558 RepID=A0A314YJI2_PRUYE|nr:hypothetical protein Pyn_00877 [Prunus yedoensis var. nudiflora]
MLFLVLAAKHQTLLDPFRCRRNEGSYGASASKEGFTPVFWESPLPGLPFSRAAGRAPNFVGDYVFDTSRGRCWKLCLTFPAAGTFERSGFLTSASRISLLRELACPGC